MVFKLFKQERTVRDLTPLIEDGWLPGIATVHRSGDVVMVDVQAIGRDEDRAGTARILSLPSGFRPASNLYGTSYRGYRTRCQSSGALSIDAPRQPVDYLHFTFLTTDEMPTGGA